MKPTGQQLLVLLELYVIHNGTASDTGEVNNTVEGCLDYDVIEQLKKMKLIKIGPRDVDQAEPVKLTRAGKHIAKAMVDAANNALPNSPSTPP